MRCGSGAPPVKVQRLCENVEAEMEKDRKEFDFSE
jgi:hypothetical protein